MLGDGGALLLSEASLEEVVSLAEMVESCLCGEDWDREEAAWASPLPSCTVGDVLLLRFFVSLEGDFLVRCTERTFSLTCCLADLKMLLFLPFVLDPVNEYTT